MKWKGLRAVAVVLGGGVLLFLLEGEARVRFYGGTGFGGTHDFDLVEIDAYSGELTLVVEGSYWIGLDFSPNRETLYAVSNELYTIDLAAGRYTEIGPLTYRESEPISMRSMTIAPDGDMYVLSSGTSDPAGESRYYRVDKATGSLEHLGTPEGLIWAIEFDAAGTLYGAEFDLMILDPSDCSIVQTIGSLDGQLLINELDFSEEGDLYGTDYDEGLFVIDIFTGAATLLTAYSGEDQVWSLATEGQRDFGIKSISDAPPAIEWHSGFNEMYKVWLSGDLVSWLPGSGILPASGTGTNLWTDQGQHALGPASEARLRFYRVEELLGPPEPEVQFYGGTGFGGTHVFDLVEVDPSTGETTLIMEGAFWTGLDFTPDGQTLYGVSNRLYLIDIAGGTYTEIAPLTYKGSEPILMLSMSISPDGQMYALSNSYSDPSEETRYYRIDTLTGSLEYLGTAQEMVWGIEFGPDGTLYGAEFDLMTLDPTNGSTLENIGSLNSALINELDYAVDGMLYGTEASKGLYQINPATGRATLITAYAGEEEVTSLATKGGEDGLPGGGPGRKTATLRGAP